MQNNQRPVTPEELNDYAARALNTQGLAIDVRNEIVYVLAKKSHLELRDTVVAIPFASVAQLAIIYIQQSQAIRDTAAQIAARNPGMKS